MLRLLLALLLAPAVLDDSVVTLPESWPVERVVLDDVPRTKLNASGTRAVYEGSATAYWRDGRTQVLEVKWVTRERRVRKEKLRLRSPKGVLPRVRIDLRLKDGMVQRAVGRFREESKTKVKGAEGVTALHADEVAVLESGHARLELDGTGRPTGLALKADGTDLAADGAGAILELERNGETVAPVTVRRVGDELVARFADPDDRVRLGLTESDGHILLRVLEVVPDDADALRLRIPVEILDFHDSPMNGTLDEESAVCLRPVTANGHTFYEAGGGAVDLGVEWVRRHGLVGGAAALVASPRADLLEAIGSVAAACGLPSPKFDGVRARESDAVRENYLFLTYYRPGDIDAVIEYAKVGGFGLILLHRNIWRETAGTYGIHPTNFPGGLKEFTAICERIRDAGLRVGLHFYGPSISPGDPLVTPVPDDGLLAWDCPVLAGSAGPEDTTITLTGAPALPVAGGGGFPGRFFRIGDEIVRYAARDPENTFTGCERGALGTTAAHHTAGAGVRHLATLWDMFLIDPDTALVDTVAANLASVVNAAGVEMVYFDGTALIPTGEFVDRWYTYNRLILTHYDAFDHPVIVQTGLGPGRDLAWYVVPRSASADGHGDIRWYLDQRTPSIESIRRGLTAPDVGWYGFDQGRPPDHLEYIAAKCLGWGCSLSVQSHRYDLEADPRARETMEMLARYARFRRESALPATVRDRLLVPGDDFRLLTDAEGGFHLFETAYEPARDIRTLTSGAHDWKVVVPAAGRIGVEIVRGEARRADADFGDPGTSTIELFHDLSPFVPGGDNDSARLVDRVQKVMNEAGPARLGVDHEFTLIEDSRVGGLAGSLTASNTGSGIGWCAVGRIFETPIDLETAAALGIWIHGDASGISLTFELWDDDDNRASQKAPVHFEGWRHYTFDFVVPQAFDRTKVRTLVIIASDLPPGRAVEVRFAALRQTPKVTAAAALPGVTLLVGTRTVVLPAAIPARGSARIDALGRLTIRPPGMTEGTTTLLPGGPIEVDAGTIDLRLEVADTALWAGDVSVRVSRLR